MRNRLKGQLIGGVPQLWEDHVTAYDRATEAYWQGGMSAAKAGFDVVKSGVVVDRNAPIYANEVSSPVAQQKSNKPYYDAFGRLVVNGVPVPHPEYEQRHDLKKMPKMRMG
jgi:hypothetical protein